jgi:hypothetical protein
MMILQFSQAWAEERNCPLESTEKGQLSIESIGTFRPALACLALGGVPTEGLQRRSTAHFQTTLPAGAITGIRGCPGHYVGLVELIAGRDWNWVGEQSGKWLEAAILCSEIRAMSSSTAGRFRS